MTRIKFPLHSETATGKFGQSLYYERRRSGPIVHRGRTRLRSPTSEQLSARFSVVLGVWWYRMLISTRLFLGGSMNSQPIIDFLNQNLPPGDSAYQFCRRSFISHGPSGARLENRGYTFVLDFIRADRGDRAFGVANDWRPFNRTGRGDGYYSIGLALFFANLQDAGYFRENIYTAFYRADVFPSGFIPDFPPNPVRPT